MCNIKILKCPSCNLWWIKTPYMTNLGKPTAKKQKIKIMVCLISNIIILLILLTCLSEAADPASIKITICWSVKLHIPFTFVCIVLFQGYRKITLLQGILKRGYTLQDKIIQILTIWPLHISSYFGCNT